jgi:hypothetical protein
LLLAAERELMKFAPMSQPFTPFYPFLLFRCIVWQRMYGLKAPFPAFSPSENQCKQMCYALAINVMLLNFINPQVYLTFVKICSVEDE